LIKRIAADAERSGQDVTVDKIEGDETVILRPVAVQRALNNLIGNAVRHGTKARIGAIVTDRAVRISVDDNGPGIPKDRRDEALQAFARLDPARDPNRGGGAGLGLAIAADIARNHGGMLRLGESTLGGLCAELVLAR
jgi:two-component system, OmpR family, osmolarity sensor histidine kinase EnvZ